MYQNNEKQENVLEKYGRDITQDAKNGKIDPVIGRDEEIRGITRILSRKTKNNPVLIGEPGVGKTAIVEGLANRIVAGDVPSFNVGNHKIRFVPHGARTYATGTSVQYYEFDTHDKTIEIKTFTNNSGRTIGTHTSTIYAYFYATFTFTRFNKVICMDHSSWADLLVFDLSDSSYKLVHGDNRRLFTGNGNFDAGEFSEDLILIHEADVNNTQYWKNCSIADLVNNTIYNVNCTGNTVAISANASNDNGLMDCIYRPDSKMSSKYQFYNPLYLATINNLANPVVKDATLTMRVMYTLEEA